MTSRERKVIGLEKATVRAMVRIFCRGNGHEGHAEEDGFCASCRALLDYSHERLDRCAFGGEKPVCAQCPIHCYRSDRRDEIRSVMRFSGPRMLLSHPWLALRHMVAERRPLTPKVRKVAALRARPD